MSHHNPPDDVLRQILVDARTIAIVGASANPEKPSHGIMKRLLAAGYHVIPVNPNETEILGQRAYRSLRDLEGPVDIVDVFRRADDAPAIADDAVAVHAKVLWLQLGVVSEPAAQRAETAGLTVVMDRCIGQTHLALNVPPKPAAITGS